MRSDVQADGTVHPRHVRLGYPEGVQRGQVRRGVPDAADHAHPAGRQRERVAQDLSQLGTVVVGDHDVGGTVHERGPERGGRLLGGRRVGVPVRVGLDQRGAEAEVAGEVQQVAGHRRGEHRDERPRGHRRRQLAVCHRTGGVCLVRHVSDGTPNRGIVDR